MPEIELILSDIPSHKSKISLFYEIDSTKIAQKYFSCLKETIKSKVSILEPERFYNFPHGYKDRKWITDQLNLSIDIINAYSPGVIECRASEIMTQDQSNYLHHFFENYRGSILKPNPFFLDAPPEVKQALENFNLLIHRYEDIHINEKRIAAGRGPSAKIVLTYEWHRKRYDLDDDDYLHFTRLITFGKWYINYCEVGKQLWDVYRDNDEVIGDENIRPLRYYSADAMIEFSRTTSEEAYKLQLEQFWSWWELHQHQFAHLGLKKYDPKNSVGLLPAATLIRNKGSIDGFNEDEIIDLIGKHQFMETVRTYE